MRRWVSLSSVKSWVPYASDAYMFKSTNQFMDAKHTSTPDMRFAEVVTVEAIAEEVANGTAVRNGELAHRDVDGI